MARRTFSGFEVVNRRHVTVPLHDEISTGTLRDIADRAGANDLDESCRWIDRNR